MTNEAGRPALIVLDVGRLDRARKELGVSAEVLADLVRRFLGRGGVASMDDLGRLVAEMREFVRACGLEEREGSDG